MTRVLVLDGPNMNLLGIREPELYGEGSLAELHAALHEQADALGVELSTYQSNHEGDLLDRLAHRDYDAALVNAGALTHTSIALRDALIGVAIPFVEVHLTDPDARESFRRTNYLADIALARFAGRGRASYVEALAFVAERLRPRAEG